MTIELNCCGLSCPEPVVRCRKAVEDKNPDALRVLVDNAAASENVCRFLQRKGYTASISHESAALWAVTAAQGPARAEAEGAQAQNAGQGTGHMAGKGASPTDDALTPGKTLVLITGENLGRGDNTLGAKLMENFLATLPELGTSLWRVVLLNGGVKLAAAPGKALDSLKALEAAGTDILVCGTCLSFYGLLEAKEVGETTNMLDVVSSLALADKIIRP